MEKKNLVMVVLCVAIGIMAVAYAAFQTALTVEGTVQATGEFAVAFQASPDACVGTKAGQETPSATATVADKTITFNTFNIYTPGDVITCTFNIKNTGNLAAKYTNHTISSGWGAATEPIKFEVVDYPETLAAQASDTVVIKFTYNWNKETQPEKVSDTFGVTFYYSQNVSE